jgi:GNAT superfamily N-acetyltransferase
MDSTPRTWRLRTELDDRPGALARIATRLAAFDCNILALSVQPVPGGVIDELVVRLPDTDTAAADDGLTPGRLVAAIRAEGGRRVGISPADVHHLIDPATAALRAGTGVLTDPHAMPEAVRTLLGADSVTVSRPGGESDADEHGGHRVSFVLADGTLLVARRGWAAFTEVELARVAALRQVLTAADATADGPTALVTADGAGLVIRPATPADLPAVDDFHSRCSAQTLFSRYHAGVRSLPRRWLHRLLSPPRGTTLLATCGGDVVAMAQLIRTADPREVEISVLVEDRWQRRGIGTALIHRLAVLARAGGHANLVAWCLRSETVFARTATRTGLPMSTRSEDGMVRIELRAAVPNRSEPAGTQHARTASDMA